MDDSSAEITAPERYLDDSRVKLNVGGKLFETTVSTLRSGGPESILAALSNRPDIFIDRDPEIFSVLLSLLRSNRLPSTAHRFSKQELADEAIYYGIESQLKSAQTPPPFCGVDASIVATIQPASDGFPSAYTAGDGNGSVWIAHGGQISSYDWNLFHTATIRTHLDDINSICQVYPEISAVGSNSAPGLHFYDFSRSRSVGSVHWTDSSDPRIYKARVSAICDSPTSIFASFDCAHKENCVIVIDKSTLEVQSELGRQSGSSAKRLVAGKLKWLPETSVLLGSSVTCGAFGYSGYIRLWDLRSGKVVWENNEPGSGRSSRFGDSFADMDVDLDESVMFKVCSKSGDLAMADLRKLGEDPWIYLQDSNPSMRDMSGSGNKVIHCYKKQVFVGRDDSLEVWSKLMDSENGNESEREGFRSMLYRRNYVDKPEDFERGVIERIQGGGERLFVSRQGAEGIEVWESSNSSRAISI